MNSITLIFYSLCEVTIFDTQLRYDYCLIYYTIQGTGRKHLYFGAYVSFFSVIIRKMWNISWDDNDTNVVC